MRLLVTSRLPSLQEIQSTYMHYGHAVAHPSRLFNEMEAADVWICDGEEVTSDLMDQWLGKAAHYPKSMLVRDPHCIPRLQTLAKERAAEIAEFPKSVGSSSAKEWAESVLQAAEMLYARTRASFGTKGVNVCGNPTLIRVVVVGTGIMGLMTALSLAQRGYSLRIVDRGPDPRFCQPKDWINLGVTSGGHNARMYTHTEADSYNEQGSEIYRDMQSIFRKTIRDDGWSVKSTRHFSPAEHAWVGAFERIPGWMAATFKRNIYDINCESGKMWKELMRTDPSLFEDVGLCEDIVRLYVESVALEASIKLNSRLGSLIQAPSTRELLDAYPRFRPAAEADRLAGGIIVDGFTVNIHLFVSKLIDRISALGGEFVWNCDVQDVVRNDKGEVVKLQSQEGDLEANHFVLSTGPTGDALLSGTSSENLIQGVLGVWLQLPNLEPRIRNSMKIHRRGHRVEDVNITVAKDQESNEDILILGGGYGYVGLDRPAPDCPELGALYDELEEVARIYFPHGYAAAKQRGPTAMYPGGRRKFCVRPFTPTGLGVFERIPVVGGGQLIITGGNNTGGFAQSPAIARAVLRSLQGEHDPIHVLFHPDRGKLPPSIVYDSSKPSSELLLGGSVDFKIMQPGKLLLLCSDSPQHRYLRYRLDKAFPGYRCIQEPGDGQVKHLFSKGRAVDAYWQKYHSFRRKVLGLERQRRAHFDDLVPQDHVSPDPDLVVDTVNCREVWEAVEKWQPELTIVSGTKYVGKKLMARAGLIINMHTGYLPEYKGNHCIFFALYDGQVDKIASTLHQLTSDLDGGDVLDRVFAPVLPTDNEDTLYTRCLEMSIGRCMHHIERFSRGERLQFESQGADGRVFRHRDRTPGKELYLWWKLKVGGLLKTTAKQNGE